MVQFGPRSGTTRRIGDALERVIGQMVAHVFSRDIPNGEQHAMSFMVTRPVLVGLTEVAERDGAVRGGDDLGEQDFVGRSRQNVTTADTAF